MTVSAGTARLAAVLSVATRIEPELIRAVRLAALPGLDVGHESEFWFCDWIASRGPDAVALRPDLLPGLRTELDTMLTEAEPGGPLSRVGELIAGLHSGLPPALLMEEKIAWLTVTHPPGYLAEVESALESALRALVADGREGISDWYLGAAARLPEEARTTRSGWLLGMAAGERYPEVRPGTGTVPGSLTATDLSRIGARLPQDRVGLAWDGADLVLSGEAGSGQAAVPVPATDPRLLDVTTAGTERTVLVAVDGTARVPAPDGRVRIRTPLGETYEVSRAGLDLVQQAAVELAPEPFAAVRELIPVTEILAAMSEAGPAREFGILLDPATYDRLEPVLPTLVRLLKTSYQADLEGQGRLAPTDLIVVFVAAGGVPPGGFRLTTDQLEQRRPQPKQPPPDPDPSLDDEIAGEFEAWWGPWPKRGVSTDPVRVLRALFETARGYWTRHGELPDQFQVELGSAVPGYDGSVAPRMEAALATWAAENGWRFPQGTRPAVRFVTASIEPGDFQIRAVNSRVVAAEATLQRLFSTDRSEANQPRVVHQLSESLMPGPAGIAFTRRRLRRGYDVDQVELFLDRIRGAINRIGPPLTPDEVLNADFDRQLGGYDEEEVDVYRAEVRDWLRGVRRRDWWDE